MNSFYIFCWNIYKNLTNVIDIHIKSGLEEKKMVAIHFALVWAHYEISLDLL